MKKRDPKSGRAKTFLLDDLRDMESLTRANEPPFHPIRPTKVALDMYSFGETSKGGYGSGLATPNMEGGGGVGKLWEPKGGGV